MLLNIFSSPGLTKPGNISPGVTKPEISSPGSIKPGNFSIPGLSPGLTSPGLKLYSWPVAEKSGQPETLLLRFPRRDVLPRGIFRPGADFGIPRPGAKFSGLPLPGAPLPQGKIFGNRDKLLAPGQKIRDDWKPYLLPILFNKDHFRPSIFLYLSIQIIVLLQSSYICPYRWL